ncbi:YraN family protein [Paracoccus aestuariivivens]|uniref:Uncharacterized protein n=1 Tax=Paracoccus aestuariivivens TaxID=1820333 RepID=A0A6L6JDN4_9RHOB|nr:YraN family protein [Paracoccus aestuariivivens]MTH78839.1 hypothetical protein [Paracoccus aestuariivivens]
MDKARVVSPSRQAKGQIAHASGCMAEDAVCRDYLDRGYALVETRWRGKSGEIDLILRCGDEYVFVEVKKSAQHSVAVERIEYRQVERILSAAAEFCAGLASGTLTPMRFDAASVDQIGRVRIIENAFGLT